MKPDERFDAWPISGKPGQDVIVTNPRNVERLNRTAPDYEQLQYVFASVRSENSKEHGFPPLLMTNPRVSSVDVVGGIHYPKHHGQKGGAKPLDATPGAAGAVAGGIDSHGWASSATNPATAWSGTESDPIETPRQDAADESSGGSSSPFPWFAVIIIGLVGLYFFKKFDLAKAR